MERRAICFMLALAVVLLGPGALLAERRLLPRAGGEDPKVFDVYVLEEGLASAHLRWSYQGFPYGARVRAYAVFPNSPQAQLQTNPGEVVEPAGTVDAWIYCCEGPTEGGGYADALLIAMWPVEAADTTVHTATFHYERNWVDDRYHDVRGPSEPTTPEAPTEFSVTALETEPGSEGSRVILRGWGFRPSMSVEFQGASPVTPEFISGEELRVTVPQGARDGTVIVRHPDGRGAGFVSSTRPAVPARPSVRVRPRRPSRPAPVDPSESSPPSPPGRERCSMPRPPRPREDCKAEETAYYYDRQSRRCQSFSWGGCIDVPFRTHEDCAAACERR